VEIYLQERFDDPQMSRRANRQELGQPFDDPKQDGDKTINHDFVGWLSAPLRQTTFSATPGKLSNRKYRKNVAASQGKEPRITNEHECDSKFVFIRGYTGGPTALLCARLFRS